MNIEKYSIKADFLEHPQRKLFCLLLEPAGVTPRHSILYLPPFAEEMHRSRHVVAAQARAMAAAGHRVMLLDLSGCGDGEGEFTDATWQIWLQDAGFAADALAALGNGAIVLWGLRLGALLACELSMGRTDVEKLIFWQPVLNGEHQIDQFLRLKTAASALRDPLAFDRKTLWDELRSGRSLEIAGYELSSSLACGIAKTRMKDCLPSCPVSWLETGRTATDSLSVASQKVLGYWREQGVRVDSSFLSGDAFWRDVEADLDPDLRHITLDSVVSG